MKSSYLSHADILFFFKHTYHVHLLNFLKIFTLRRTSPLWSHLQPLSQQDIQNNAALLTKRMGVT